MDVLLLERGLDLDSDPVRFLLYPQITSAVLAHPVRPDDRQHDLALLEHAAYVLAEIDAERRRVVVHEDDVLGGRIIVELFEMSLQTVEEFGL